MLRTVVIGLGPIGASCGWALHRDPRFDLMGLVDPRPEKVGKTLAELTDCVGPGDGPAAVASLDALGAEPDVAVVSVSRNIHEVLPVLHQLAERGIAAVTSCEAMLWPWYAYGAEAEALDAAAKSGGAPILGTGVNPGYVMDYLAVVLSTVVREVHEVRCVRQVDANARRAGLMSRIGLGLDAANFERFVAEDQVGLRGLPESLCLLAAGLGRTVEPGAIEQTTAPILAERTYSGRAAVEPGFVCGLRAEARWQQPGLKVHLSQIVQLEHPEPKDVVAIEGPTSVKLKIPGGLHGDGSTVATLVNHAACIRAAQPGIRTLLDLPPVGCRTPMRVPV